MKETNNTELTKWRWYALAVTLLGIVLYAVPWIPSRYKFILTVPLYAMFVYVYYKYMCVKKEAQAAASKESDPDRQKISSGQNANKRPTQKGRAAGKKV